MIIQLTMPQFGESITEGHIVRWLKSPGDFVNENEPLLEMETEKSVFSYESPYHGKLVKILENDGSKVSVGKVIAEFEVSAEDGKKYQKLVASEHRTDRINSVRTSGESDKAQARQMGVSGGERYLPLTPLIRSLAKERGLALEDVAKIKGSGPEGRITKEDVLQFAPQRLGGVEVSVSPIRARIAERMTLSKTKIPHAGTGVDVDMSAIEIRRHTEKAAPSYLSFSLFAVVQALKKFPLLNSSWKESEGRVWIEQYESVHLGVAVSTRDGLLVPVIRNAEKKTFLELGREAERLAETARQNKLNMEELTGATFTVNNTGALGAVRSLQIIPPPQCAIIALNRVVKRPWVVNDKIEIRPILSLDLAFDHRIIDGAEGIGFLNAVKENLENFNGSTT